jgi:hypothetical protein
MSQNVMMMIDSTIETVKIYNKHDKTRGFSQSVWFLFSRQCLICICFAGCDE